METTARELIMLETLDGKVPFEEWFEAVRDRGLQNAIDARLARLEDVLRNFERSI